MTSQNKYNQRGYNSKYPQEIITWRYGSPIPSWLSNIAKVAGLDEITGNPILSIRFLKKGGYEIIDSGGGMALVQTRGKEDYVCLGDGKIFSLTPKQFDLLYGSGKENTNSEGRT